MDLKTARPIVCGIVAGLRFFFVHLDPQAMLPCRAQTDSQRTRVSGQVLDEESGRPLRYIHVNLIRSQGGRSRAVATTDGRGQFVFEGIEAGEYRFELAGLGLLPKPGRLTTRGLNSKTARSSVLSPSEDLIALSENESVDVEVPARKGGVLKGRITFADGSPAPNALVSVWKIGSDGSCQKVNIWHGPTSVLYTSTDDLGHYRVAGLGDGRYAVSATVDFPIVGESEERRWTKSRPSLAPTYSGGGAGCSDAVSVLVQKGRETEGVSIVLGDRPTYSVSGTLTSLLTGSPIQQAELTIQRDDGDPDLENSTSPDSNGHWKFEALQSGKYTISVVPRVGIVFDGNRVRAIPGGIPERYARKQQPVKIDDADVVGVAIRLSTGTRIEGQMTIEGGGTLPSEVEVRIVRDQIKNIRPGLLDYFARVGSDGQFVMNGVSEGEARFIILGLEKKGLYLKSIVWNDQDLKAVPFRITGEPVITGVRIVLARN